jgi:glycosyltransferase involved in cell wall biosynthesis
MKPKRMIEKKIIFFSSNLDGVGGAERLLFEEANYFQKNGLETHLLTFIFNEKVLFNKSYNISIERVGKGRSPANNIFIDGIHFINNILTLRKKIKEIDPDIILLSSSWDCKPFYFATMFTKYSYSTHIHGSIFWFPEDKFKYAFIYRKVFNQIRNSVVGHKEFIPLRPLNANIMRRIINEFVALLTHKAIRKAEHIFVLSSQMKWEIWKLYGKDAFVAKGALPTNIFAYTPKQDIRMRLGLNEKKIILNINRLDKKKRVDLLIKSFKQVSERFDDACLIIGGVGPEEARLKLLTEQLGLTHKIIFIGYVKEEELWDYYISCDVFVHPNWADFAIAALEPLALQKKVVWSTEMEVDDHLKNNKHIFIAEPTDEGFAKAIEKALSTQVNEKNDLSIYTWDQYGETVMGELTTKMH